MHYCSHHHQNSNKSPPHRNGSFSASRASSSRGDHHHHHHHHEHQKQKHLIKKLSIDLENKQIELNEVSQITLFKIVKFSRLPFFYFQSIAFQQGSFLFNAFCLLVAPTIILATDFASSLGQSKNENTNTNKHYSISSVATFFFAMTIPPSY